MRTKGSKHRTTEQILKARVAKLESELKKTNEKDKETMSEVEEYLELAHKFSKERGGYGLTRSDVEKAQAELKKKQKNMKTKDE